MRLICLMENSGPAELVHEHGLCLYLEYNGSAYLLDAGSSGRSVQNAARLGVELSAVKAAFLSHGHYDHGDGLSGFFAVNAHAPVYLRPDALNPQFHSAGPIQKFIGLNPALLRDHAARFVPHEGLWSPAEGLWLVPDSVSHEQSLVVETDCGLVVLNSCCHAGAGYIVKEILDRFPGQTVRALVGGFHLMGAPGPHTLGVPPGIVKNLAHWLTEELGVSQIYTGHCTGTPAYDLLHTERPDCIFPLTTGLTIEFE